MVARALRDRGILVIEESGRLTVKPRGSSRYYAIREEVLDATADYFSWIVPAVPDTSPVGGCSNKPSKHQSIPTVPVVPTLNRTGNSGDPLV